MDIQAAGFDADALARAVADKMYAADRAARAMGIQIEEVKAGFARVAFVVRDDMLNGHDIAHGGYIFALADTAFAYACNSGNRKTIALDCTITFTSAGLKGARLVATARERSRGGRTGSYDVEVADLSGKLVALFRGTSYGVSGSIL